MTIYERMFLTSPWWVKIILWYLVFRGALTIITHVMAASLK